MQHVLEQTVIAINQAIVVFNASNGMCTPRLADTIIKKV